MIEKALGCMLGGLIGDALGTPTENMRREEIRERFGWVSEFDSSGTDDTIMKDLLAETLIRTEGRATIDDWAATWVDRYGEIFGPKVGKFFPSVLHTAAKLRHRYAPRAVALGNMPSSSSAMCISPVGVVNMLNPREAARQAYELAALIHTYDVAFCCDGAACMAAAVAAAFEPEASVASIVESAVETILPTSGREMLTTIDAVMNVARETGEFEAFAREMYRRETEFFRPIACDSRETVPLTLAILHLADGDFERTVTYAANFGRDADTIASMAGAIVGAFLGADSIRPDWKEKATAVAGRDQDQLARDLVETARKKAERAQSASARALGALGRDLRS
ncbi:MAG: hypothetical protein EA426_18200 [Spirochaetaceae bacterium]|nr:MAG: hypothetical protein EA426_18200 [Spirochaetaceae bacterium]